MANESAPFIGGCHGAVSSKIGADMKRLDRVERVGMLRHIIVDGTKELIMNRW